MRSQAGLDGDGNSAIAADALGSATFRADYGVRYAYLVGSMFKAIASREMVVKLGRAGILGFYGSGGMRIEDVAEAVRFIQSSLRPGQPYGVNLLGNPHDAEAELRLALLLLDAGVPVVEASGFTRITPALVALRARGLSSGVASRRIIAKVSHPKVAREFLTPPSTRLLRQAVERGLLTQADADLAAQRPVADDLCVEADSGGHTDIGSALTLLPRMIGLRNELRDPGPMSLQVRIGAAGGIGTPQAVAAAFLLGADFVLTGSVNQCTPEAGTSVPCKDLLQRIDVRDTGYAPAGDQFEHDTQVQVVRRGTLFAQRARHLRDLWRQHDSIEQLDETTRIQIEQDYFDRSFEEVLCECEQYYARTAPARLERARADSKARLAMVFRWYFVRTARLAQVGDPRGRLDYQIHCGPALGAFNYWAQGTALEHWRDRHVDTIAIALMTGGARHLSKSFTRPLI